MPFLDNLILGKPGGDRRQRYLDSGNLDRGEAGPDQSGRTGQTKQGALLGSLLTLQRGGEEQGRVPEERERRSCGNPTCGRSWTLPWKNREHPIFDGQWACSRACLSAMVKGALTRETGDGIYEDGPKPHHHRLPLGLVMLAQGWITHPELQRALEAQRTHGSGRIGEWLVSECGMKPERIARGLGAQWNCPVLSVEGSWPEAMALALPRVFLEEYGVVPLRVAGKKILYVGFQDSLDASASFALERMTGLRAESGLLPEEEFMRARETLLRCEFPRQSMATAGDRDGLARAIAETVEHEQPEASRLVRLHRYYWLRVWAKGEVDRAAGDLPSNANGVRDYLFTIGSRVAYPIQNPTQDERRSRAVATPERPSNAVDEPEDIAAAGTGSDEPSTATEAELAGEATLPEHEPAAFTEVEAGAGAQTAAASKAAAADTAEIELDGPPTAAIEAYVERDGAVGAPVSVSIRELVSVRESISAVDGSRTRHSLARREAWFDNYAGDDEVEATKTVYQERPADLQRFMRREFGAELETIDGEYLPVEATGVESTALAPEGRLTSWNRFGLLKRLKPSFLNREAGPGSGPGQGV